MAWQNGTTQQILRVLEEYGPMTRAEICRELKQASNISSLLSILLREQPTNPRRAHICGWVYDMEGERQYPRAVYALGDKPDARKPRPKKRTEIVSAYRARLKAKYQMNSVFNLARRVPCNARSAEATGTASRSLAGRTRTSGESESVTRATTTG